MGNILIAGRCHVLEIAISLRAITGGFACLRRGKPGEANPAEVRQEVSTALGDGGGS